MGGVSGVFWSWGSFFPQQVGGEFMTRAKCPDESGERVVREILEEERAIAFVAARIAPGVVEGLNPWKDEEPCPHPGSAPMSSDDVRSRWRWTPRPTRTGPGGGCDASAKGPGANPETLCGRDPL